MAKKYEAIIHMPLYYTKVAIRLSNYGPIKCLKKNSIILKTYIFLFQN